MKRLAIVLNPDSGKTETSRAEISKLFKSNQFELKFFDITKGIDVLQKHIQKYSPNSVIAVGGDGTINTVANIAVQLNLPMGVIPAGTLNHFAKDLGLPQDSTQAAVTITKQHITKIDYGSVNGHIFVNNCNLGVYPEIVRKRNKLSLPSKWLAGMVAAIQVRLQHERQRYDITTDDLSLRVRAGAVFIGNNSYRLEGTTFTTRERLDQGTLQLVIIKTGRIRHFARILLSFIFKHPHEKVATYQAQNIQIRPRQQLTKIAVDGEVIELETPLEVKTHPKSLKVLV